MGSTRDEMSELLDKMAEHEVRRARELRARRLVAAALAAAGAFFMAWALWDILGKDLLRMVLEPGALDSIPGGL